MGRLQGVRARGRDTGGGGVVVQGRQGLPQGAAHVRVPLGVAAATATAVKMVELDGGLWRAPAVGLRTEEKRRFGKQTSRVTSRAPFFK